MVRYFSSVGRTLFSSRALSIWTADLPTANRTAPGFRVVVSTGFLPAISSLRAWYSLSIWRSFFQPSVIYISISASCHFPFAARRVPGQLFQKPVCGVGLSLSAFVFPAWLGILSSPGFGLCRTPFLAVSSILQRSFAFFSNSSRERLLTFLKKGVIKPLSASRYFLLPQPPSQCLNPWAGYAGFVPKTSLFS